MSSNKRKRSENSEEDTKIEEVPIETKEKENDILSNSAIIDDQQLNFLSVLTKIENSIDCLAKFRHSKRTFDLQKIFLTLIDMNYPYKNDLMDILQRHGWKDKEFEKDFSDPNTFINELIDLHEKLSKFIF